MVLSLSRDLNFVQKIPAAENARSASTEVGGIRDPGIPVFGMPGL
jgi:hypothetical protein